MTLLRRFVVLTALMFWQGGFLFYAAVVVPIGQQVLRSPTDQGFITRRVSVYLNLVGAIALAPLAWDLVAGGEHSTRRRRLRGASWCVMLVCQVLLFWLHPQLDRFLDPEGMEVLDRQAFRLGHRVYLWAHTIQWVFGVVYVVLMLQAWRIVDGNERK